MKRCPRCNETYSAEFEFCVIDGWTLDEDRDFEAETVARGTPIVVNLGQTDREPKTRQPTQDSARTTAATPPSSNYRLVFGGIVIGGGLVLATVLIMNLLKIPPPDKPENRSADQNSINNQSNGNSRPENANLAGVNSDVASTNLDTPEAVKTPEKRTPEKDMPSTPNPTPKITSRYNGRVIMLNAIVRSAPSIHAPEVNIVTFNEPIKIGKSAGGNSPWYRVTTASGQAGWIHGNTIEFVR